MPVSLPKALFKRSTIEPSAGDCATCEIGGPLDKLQISLLSARPAAFKPAERGRVFSDVPRPLYHFESKS